MTHYMTRGREFQSSFVLLAVCINLTNSINNGVDERPLHAVDYSSRRGRPVLRPLGST